MNPSANACPNRSFLVSMVGKRWLGPLAALVLASWALWGLPTASKGSAVTPPGGAEPLAHAWPQEPPREELLQAVEAFAEREPQSFAQRPERLVGTAPPKADGSAEFLAALRPGEVRPDPSLGQLHIEVFGPTGKPFTSWFQAEAIGEDWIRQAPAPKFGKTVLSNLSWGEAFTVRITPPSGWNVATRPVSPLIQGALETASPSLSLTLQPPRPRLRGSIVDPRGQPLRDEAMELWLPGGLQLGFATDDQGRFDLWIPVSDRGQVTFRSVGEFSRAPALADRMMPSMTLGEQHDFGVVAVQNDALLLSGRFVQRDGMPISLQNFEVLQEVAPDDWRVLVTGQTDALGWTEIPWQATLGPLDLRLRSAEPGDALSFRKQAQRLGLTRLTEPEGYYLVQPQPVLPGRRATWVWDRGSTVVGSVEYEPGRRPLLTILCRPEHGRARRYERWRPTWREGLRDPRFTFLGIPAGPVTLEIWSEERLLHRRTDVVPVHGRLTESLQNLTIPALPRD